MRARGDENGDVFRPDLRHLLEEREQRVAARLSPGDVAHGNRDALPHTHELAQWRTIERSPNRTEQRRMRIRNSRSRNRLDDGDPFVRKIDLETVGPVIQSYSHLVSGRWLVVSG